MVTIHCSVLVLMYCFKEQAKVHTEFHPVQADELPGYPAGITADDNGAIYISDFFNQRIWPLGCSNQSKLSQARRSLNENQLFILIPYPTVE